MSSKAKRRRDRLARRRKTAQEIAISEERERKRRWGDGHIFGPKIDVDLPPMRDVSEVVTARAEEPWPMIIRPIKPYDVHFPVGLRSIGDIPLIMVDVDADAVRR